MSRPIRLLAGLSLATLSFLALPATTAHASAAPAEAALQVNYGEDASPTMTTFSQVGYMQVMVITYEGTGSQTVQGPTGWIELSTISKGLSSGTGPNYLYQAIDYHVATDANNHTWTWTLAQSKAWSMVLTDYTGSCNSSCLGIYPNFDTTPIESATSSTAGYSVSSIATTPPTTTKNYMLHAVATSADNQVRLGSPENDYLKLSSTACTGYDTVVGEVGQSTSATSPADATMTTTTDKAYNTAGSQPNSCSMVGYDYSDNDGDFPGGTFIQSTYDIRSE